MFVEHQSTSGTKIHNTNAPTRALLLNYGDTEITAVIVTIRNYNKSSALIPQFKGCDRYSNRRYINGMGKRSIKITFPKYESKE